MDPHALALVLVVGATTSVGSVVWSLNQRFVTVRAVRRRCSTASIHAAGATPAGSSGSQRWRRAIAEAPIVVVRRVTLRHRRRPPDDADVARWCDALARALRAGDSLAGAVRRVEAPAALETHLAPVVLALDRGADLATAVTSLRGRSAGLDAASAVIRACATLGGPAAEPLDRVGVSLRRRLADAAERRTQSAQARLSAIVLTVLPGAALGLMIATSGAVRTSVATPAGMASVMAGGVLNVVGWWWMRHTIRGAS